MMKTAHCHPDKIQARLRALLMKPYSGTLIAVTTATVAMVLLTASWGFGLDWARTWRLIGFPGVALPPFFDLDAITVTAAECARAGEKYPFLGCGYISGRYNYPPVWLLLGQLGISAADTKWLAVFVELPAIILLIALLSRRTIGMGLLALPIVLSPSTILAVERGNTDLVEWSLVCAAALIYSERRKAGAIAAALLLSAGIALKLLPLFCTSLLVRLNRTAFAVAIALTAFTALYLFSLTDALPYIRKISPVTPYISYGYTIIFDRFENLYAPQLGLDVAGLSKSWIPHAAVIGAIVLAGAIALAAWRRRSAACLLDGGRDGTAFLFGAGIFCGSFLFLGTNYAYRLIFLLLCLPQLFDWIAGGQTSRRIAQTMIAASIVSMWLKFHPEKTLHINQIADWILFVMMMTAMALTALRALRPASLTRNG